MSTYHVGIMPHNDIITSKAIMQSQSVSLHSLSHNGHQSLHTVTSYMEYQ